MIEQVPAPVGLPRVATFWTFLEARRRLHATYQETPDRGRGWVFVRAHVANAVGITRRPRGVRGRRGHGGDNEGRAASRPSALDEDAPRPSPDEIQGHAGLDLIGAYQELRRFLDLLVGEAPPHTMTGSSGFPC